MMAAPNVLRSLQQQARHASSSSKLPVASLYKALDDRGFNFYAGVPDSLLKDFCAYVTDNSQNHIIAANEGTALATACGYHLATKQKPIVYLQNSGLGNLVNPLLSLVNVYKIPVLVLVGWRGEPGVKDEPQHVLQGALQNGMLESMKTKFGILPSDESELPSFLDEAANIMENNEPYFVLVRKDLFEKYNLQNTPLMSDEVNMLMSRREATQVVCDVLPDEKYAFIASTGFPGRELYEVRNEQPGDFLCVGSMGHASAIAYGIALSSSGKNVVCLDGDGAALMHLGQMAINGTQDNFNKKLIHILLNNGLHESVGGQPTVGKEIDFCGIAKACNYEYVRQVKSEAQLKEALADVNKSSSPQKRIFIEVLIKPGTKKDLARPKTSPEENKDAFMAKNF